MTHTSTSARSTRQALVILSVMVCYSCADGPAAITVPETMSIAIAPWLPAGQTHPAGITSERITVRNATSNTVVAIDSAVINAGQQSLSFSAIIPKNTGSVNVIVELLNAAGSVEWSGSGGPVIPVAGAAPLPIELFQGPVGNLTVTRVVIAPRTTTVVEGSRIEMTATVTGGGSGSRVSWSSLDTLIATVNEDGSALTRRDGSARIVAVAGPRADTATITATQRPATVIITPDTVRLASLGAETTFSARVVDPRGRDIAGAIVTWSAANTSVATPLGSGRFRAAANGNAQIVATSAANSALQANAMLVVAQRVTAISVSPLSVSLRDLNATQQFTAITYDANGNPAGTALVWRTSNDQVATIDANGLAKAIGTGTAQISAVVRPGSADSVVAVTSVIVSQAARSITLTPGTHTLRSVGETVGMTAIARDMNGTPIPNFIFIWSSSQPNVATVDSKGVVRAVANGVTSIVADAGDASASATITVEPQPAPPPARFMTLTPGEATLTSLSAVLTMSAVLRDANGNVVPNVAFSWSSSRPEVATVDANGVVRAIANGVTSIRVNGGGATASANIGVAASVTSVTVTPAAVTMTSLGSTTRLTAVAYDANGLAMPYVSLTWSSSRSDVASVEPDGTVYAHSDGVTAIIASAGGASDTAIITVTHVIKLVIMADYSTIDLGDSLHFRVYDHGINGGLNPIPEPLVIHWRSNDTRVATIDQNGLAKGVGFGITYISAVVQLGAGDSAIAIASLRVSSQGIRYIQLSPHDTTLRVLGASVVLTATAYDAHANAIPNITFSWSSFRPNVATVDANGVVRAVAPGYTYITADAGNGMTASAIVTVDTSSAPPPVQPPQPGPSGAITGSIPVVGQRLATSAVLTLASNPAGVTVHLASNNDSRLLLSRDFTYGTAAIDVVVPAGVTNISFQVQGMSGDAGAVTITASAPGFATATFSTAVRETVYEIVGLSNPIPWVGGSGYQMRVGILSPDFIEQPVGPPPANNYRWGYQVLAQISDTLVAGLYDQMGDVDTGSGTYAELRIAPGESRTDPRQGYIYARAAGTVTLQVSTDATALPGATRTVSVQGPPSSDVTTSVSTPSSSATKPRPSGHM